MSGADTRSDTPIRRAALKIADPVLGIEAPWVAWVAAAGAGVPTALTLFWLTYGAFTLIGASAVAAALISAAGAILVGGAVALLAGVLTARFITTETPLLHHVAVFTSELQAPHRPDRTTRHRLPPPPENLSAPRRGPAPLPPHFDQENACVRPECLGPDEGRMDSDP